MMLGVRVQSENVFVLFFVAGIGSVVSSANIYTRRRGRGRKYVG